MPKGLDLKGFGRRKSSGNILDLPSPEEQSAGAAPSSTFRVIERPEKKGVSYGAAPDRSVNRTFPSPIHALRGKSENDLSKGSARPRVAGWPHTGATRGSGGTTNSGSSGYYDSYSASARHSSTSTLPSSVDPDRHPEEEELFAKRASVASGMYQSVSAGADIAPLPQPPSFSSRAARAFSFGNRKNGSRNSTDRDAPPVPPVHQSTAERSYSVASTSSPQRERAMTTSSYASTAVPSKPELNFGNDFGDDFGSGMFDSLQKEAPPPLPMSHSFNRTESEPKFPPRTPSKDSLSNSPPPSPIQHNCDDNASPYSYDESNSAGLSSSSALSSSAGPSNGPADGIAQAFLGNSKTGYARVPDRYASPVLEKHSTENFSGAGFMADNGKAKEQEYPNRQTHVDDDDRWVKKVELHDPQASTPNRLTAGPARGNTAYGQAVASSSRNGAASPGSSAGGSWAGADSITTSPRAAGRPGLNRDEGSMFDASPSGPASRAIRPAVRNTCADNTPKKMTKARFQALQRRNESSTEQSEEEDNDSSEEYDDDDDVERAKKLAAQRRQQEATMSVYRQKMKKVTGGGPTDLPSSGASVRPGNHRSASSASGFYFGGISGTPPPETVRGNQTGDDEDVPLGILQAHGFPSASKSPMMNENDSHQRRASIAGSAMGGAMGGGNLPAFARKLPADPYFGAGLVNQSTRESLATNGAGSVYGMATGQQVPMQQGMGHPGGLVGVIAGEEKARAARRGNPNTAAAFAPAGSMPANGPQQMGRAMSMGNLAPPSVYTPTGIPPMPMMPQMGMSPMGMPPMGQMPMTPGMDPQMQQFMQMQMQMMQNMINMQQAQLGQPAQPQQDNSFLGASRPMSLASQQSYAPPNQGRSRTMMNPPAGWTHSPSQSRPASAMAPMGTYAPSMNGLHVNGGGSGAGYTPSIAPSERSNVGMPIRYRPVTQYGEPAGRTQSMTSSHTLQAFTNQQKSPGPGTLYNGTQSQGAKSTIRVVDKPKGSPRLNSRGPAVEDEDESWGDLKKNREVKKSRFGFGRSKKESSSQEPPLSNLYQSMD